MRQYFTYAMVLACVLCLSACESGPAKPEQQKAFAARLAEDYTAYDKASTDVQRSQAVQKRQHYMAEWGAAPEFTGWICTVADVRESHNADVPRKMLVLELDCGDFILSNILEGKSPDAFAPAGAILEGTNDYDVALRLNAKDTVTVSGRFMVMDSGHIRETSFTEAGGMRQPEFGVIYTSIIPAKK